MAYCAYITRIKNLRMHPNADRLQCGECFGNTVIVSMDTTPEQLGVYFPVDGQLGEEFATANDLLRRKDADGNPAGGYLDPDKRNVKALRLRGSKSDGLFLPMESLSGFTDITKLREGDTITVLNGVTICRKYIPAVNKPSTGPPNAGGRHRKRRGSQTQISPLFLEHSDTSQLAYNLEQFRHGDRIEITLKMHGTSGRTAYLPCFQRDRCRNRLLQALYDSERTPDWIARRIHASPEYAWDLVSGTRRCVLSDYDGGFYGTNAFRRPHAHQFLGKLRKGEEVYYEIVGFLDTGAPIMASCDNKRIGDKEFTKQYGKTTIFSYGCDPTGVDAPQSQLYVYRMTMTNEDGDVVEYPPDFLRYRCEQMGVPTVPLLWSGEIPENAENPGLWVQEMAEQFYDGPDPIGKSHVREGVVVRIVNRPIFTAYKHKNFTFKCLEGIVKDTAAAPDLEEMEELKGGAA